MADRCPICDLGLTPIITAKGVWVRECDNCGWSIPINPPVWWINDRRTTYSPAPNTAIHIELGARAYVQLYGLGLLFRV